MENFFPHFDNMDLEHQHPGKVEDGRYIPADPVAWSMALGRLNSKPVMVTLKQLFGKRTVKQNNAWHGIVVPIYMACAGHINHDFAHYELVTHIDPLVTIDIKGREKIGPTPTRNKNTKESMELYRKAQDFIATEYGADVPDPSPDWKGFSA